MEDFTAGQTEASLSQSLTEQGRRNCTDFNRALDDGCAPKRSSQEEVDHHSSASLLLWTPADETQKGEGEDKIRRYNCESVCKIKTQDLKPDDLHFNMTFYDQMKSC